MIPILIIGGIGVAILFAMRGKMLSSADTAGIDTTPPAPEVPTFSAVPDVGITDVSDSTISSMDWTQEITTDPATWPSGDKIWDICRAIARAEGYNTNGAAFNLNNPGDLSPGDEHGYTTNGAAEWHGGSYIIHFATAADGWNACYTKVSNIVNGKSKVYGQNWTVAQISQKWAGNYSAWANNVGSALNIDPNNYGFSDYVNS